jgi:translation initiation factor IF-2
LAQHAAATQKKVAHFILRADVQGSLEALKSSLLNIRSDKIEVNIISAGVGEISESDIELAAAADAVVVGFHTQVENHAEGLIKQKGVKVVLFDLIYHALDAIKELLVERLDKIAQERDLGMAEVLTTFKASHLGVIAGCIVQEGVIQRSMKVRLIRDKEVVWKGSIHSLKRVKEDVKEVKKGLECGILLAGFNEVQPGDKIQCYEIYYLTQEL